MVNIAINEVLKKKLPDLVLGIIEANVLLSGDNAKLRAEMEEFARTFKNSADIEEISSMSAVSATRKAYKICGKDPARYRPSAEALLRRVTKGLDLPRVNNAVDLLNLASLKTGLSIGGYDADKISGNITMDIGSPDEEYEAIGRGKLNIGSLPVLKDNSGVFGSPTSDSERTSVTLSTGRFLMVIFGFSGKNPVIQAIELSENLLKKYAAAESIKTFLVN